MHACAFMGNSALRDFVLYHHACYNQRELPLFSEGIFKYHI